MSDEELIEDIEYGRNCEIAKEVFKDFLEGRRSQIIRNLELKYFEDANQDLSNMLAELRIIRKFRDFIENGIYEGKTAEKELKRDGNESDEEN